MSTILSYICLTPAVLLYQYEVLEICAEKPVKFPKLRGAILG